MNNLTRREKALWHSIRRGLLMLVSAIEDYLDIPKEKRKAGG